METLDLLEVGLTSVKQAMLLKAVWRYASLTSGGLCVTICGTALKQVWHASS